MRRVVTAWVIAAWAALVIGAAMGLTPEQDAMTKDLLRLLIANLTWPRPVSTSGGTRSEDE